MAVQRTLSRHEYFFVFMCCRIGIPFSSAIIVPWSAINPNPLYSSVLAWWRGGCPYRHPIMGVVFFCNCMSVGIQKVAEGSFRPGVGAIIVDVSFLGYRAARTMYKEDFTLPHRFLVIPPGIHMDSRWNLFGREPSQIFVYFHLHSTCIPDGLNPWIPPYSTSLYTVIFTFL